MNGVNRLLKKATPVELLSREGIDLTQVPAFAGLNAALFLFSLNPVLMAGLAAGSGAFLALQIWRKQKWREAIRSGKLIQDLQAAAQRYTQYLEKITENLSRGISISESQSSINRDLRALQADFERLLKDWESIKANQSKSRRIDRVASRGQLATSRESLPKDARLILSIQELGAEVQKQVEAFNKSDSQRDAITKPVEFYKEKILSLQRKLFNSKTEDLPGIEKELAEIVKQIEAIIKNKNNLVAESEKVTLQKFITGINEFVIKKSIPAQKEKLAKQETSSEALSEEQKRITELRKAILDFAKKSANEQFTQLDSLLQNYLKLVSHFRIEIDNSKSQLTPEDKAKLRPFFTDQIEDVYGQYVEPLVTLRSKKYTEILQKIKTKQSPDKFLQKHERIKNKITELESQGKISKEQAEDLRKKLERKKRKIETYSNVKVSGESNQYLRAIEAVNNRLKSSDIEIDELNSLKTLLEEFKQKENVSPVEKVQLTSVLGQIIIKIKQINKAAATSEQASAPPEVRTETSTETPTVATSAPPAARLQQFTQQKQSESAEANAGFNQFFVIPLYLKSYQDDANKLLEVWGKKDTQEYSENDEKIKWAWYQAVYEKLTNSVLATVKTQIDNLVEQWAKTDGNTNGSYSDENTQKMQLGWATKEIVERMLSETEAELPAPERETAETSAEAAASASETSAGTAGTTPTAGTETAPEAPATPPVAQEAAPITPTQQPTTTSVEAAASASETSAGTAGTTPTAGTETGTAAPEAAATTPAEGTGTVPGFTDERVNIFDDSSEGLTEEETHMESWPNDTRTPISDTKTGVNTQKLQQPLRLPQSTSPRFPETGVKQRDGSTVYDFQKSKHLRDHKSKIVEEIVKTNHIFSTLADTATLPCIEAIRLDNQNKIIEITISPKGNLNTLKIGDTILLIGGSSYLSGFDNQNASIKINISYEKNTTNVSVTSLQDRNLTVASLVLECNQSDTVSLTFQKTGSLVSAEGVVRDFPGGIFALLPGSKDKQMPPLLMKFLQNNYKKRVRFEYSNQHLQSIILQQNLVSKLLQLAGLSRPISTELKSFLTRLGLNESESDKRTRGLGSDLIISINQKPKQ